MNIDWSHIGDHLKEPTTGCDDESGEQRTRADDALDWSDENRWADLKSSERVTLCKV